MTVICFWGFIIWCFINYNVDAEKYEALIFNGQKHSLIYKPKNSNVNWSNWDLACPSNDREHKFAEKYSFYNERALFKKKNYYEKTIYENLGSSYVYTNVCDEAFRLSILIAEYGLSLEFGYEIYYKSSTYSNIRETVYNDYLPLKFLLKYKSAWRDKNPCSIVTSCFAVNNVDKLLLDNEEQMEFLWIPLFKVSYPMKDHQFRKIVYEIHRNNIDASLSCDDYNVGQELFDFFEETSTGHPMYSKENQMIAFGGVELPPAETEGACELEYECLIKWQLIPADQFQFGYSKHLSCSNLTTIPIWKSTIEGVMKKLDLYLYRVSNKPLRVTAGTTGTLQLKSTKKSWIQWPWEANSYVFLNEKNKLRVSNIIYKMVRYQSKQCEGGLKFCWHGIVIVIHNGPYVVEEDRICEQDKTVELGWDDIKFIDGVESKFIYVCSISKETFSKIGLSFKKDEPVQDLSLSHFPYFDEQNQSSWKDLKKEILLELDRLSESGGKFKLSDSEIIERPSLDSDKYINSQDT